MLELASLVGHQARYRGDATGIVFEDERLTWREFADRVARCGNALRSLGVGRGDRVATLLGNSRELLEIYWAAPTIGAVLVPLSPLLLPAGLASLLADADAKCIVTQASLLPLLEPVRGTLSPALGERILLIDGAADGTRSYAELCAQASPAIEPAACGPDDPYNLMYTSGTTGLPKGIVHTHFIRSMYCLLLSAAWRMTPESVVLHAGAIVFNGAFVTMMPCFYLGGRYVLARQFDPERTIELIERERVTHVMLVPAQIIALLNTPGFSAERLATLEMVLSLGAPLLNEHNDRLNAALPGRLHELYGLTEGFLTILDRTEAVRKAGSVGRVPPFHAMRILREDGTECGPGEIGEITGRGPMLMPGYHQRPDLTEQAIRDGWLHTGDMGHVDADGYLYLVDRKKDMIDTGGVKVYPRDIEEVAATHPDVQEVAVFGVPDEKWGETPLAAVLLKPGAGVTVEALRDWINERVGARYQRVSRVVFHAAFPRSAAGKTLKRDLRTPYWAGTGRQV